MRAAEYVDDTMFYREGHRRIFRAMIALTERGDAVDPLTLADELGRRGELEASGGREYIGWLMDAVPTAANVEYHAKIVREKAQLRRLARIGADLGEMVKAGKTANEVQERAESLIFQAGEDSGELGSGRSRRGHGKQETQIVNSHPNLAIPASIAVTRAKYVPWEQPSQKSPIVIPRLVSVMLSNRSNSIRVAPREWIAKLIPSSLTVAPRGSGVPGKIFLIFGMISQAVGAATGSSE